jgi:NAD(P)-dependent dehydrogenase (short-subunit alcohol dehydrogenase family)
MALEGKVALVTGASQGIGLASARALAQDGATVVIMGRRQDALAAARSAIVAQVPTARIEMSAGDAVDESDVLKALNFAHGLYGRLDMLVSVVGNPTFKPILMRDLAGVREEIDVNFITGFLMVRHGAPLLPRGGSIVCVSSAAVTQPNWGLSIYSAAKAALERFVKAAAFELGGAGIRVNALRPGATLPPERAQSAELAGLAQAFAAETPFGRVGLPEEIASVVRFLAGPESGWVTGQTFTADGGMEQGKGPDFMDDFFGKELMDQVRAGKSVCAPSQANEPR